MIQDTVYPGYCPACRKLIFISQNDCDHYVMLDHTGSKWVEHGCSDINATDVIDVKVLDDLFQNFLKLPILNFKWRKPRKPVTNRILSTGVVVSVSHESTGNTNLEVVTCDNRFITLKVVNDSSEITSGKILDLSSAMRIGVGKFRAQKLKYAKIPAAIMEKVGKRNEYYKIAISSDDQEKLEVFINQLLMYCKKKNVPIFGVIPVPIVKRDTKLFHTRQIFILPMADMMKKISELHIPEQFEIAIEQSKISV